MMVAEVATGQSYIRTRRLTRGVGVGGAVLATVAVWVVGEPLLGYDLVVEQPGQEARDLGLSAFVVFSLAASLLGWLLLAVLERLTRRARTIWTVVALLVLIVSVLPVLQVSASGGTKAVLALTHLAVGAILIPVFRRTAVR
jgi:hypothetical protein